jgi:hypothetical protein
MSPPQPFLLRLFVFSSTSGLLLCTIPRVFALIRSACLMHYFQSFCAHSLPLLFRVVSAAGLRRGAAKFVFACELVVVVFLEFELLRRAHREGSYVVKDECSSAALEL